MQKKSAAGFRLHSNSSDESRYYTPSWKFVERQASEDYKAGCIEFAENIDAMFRKIENDQSADTQYSI